MLRDAPVSGDTVRHTLWYALPILVGNLIPLVSIAVFTRALAPAEYGAWALAYAYAVFATSLANFGLVFGYERDFFEYPKPADRAALLYSVLAFVGVAFLVVGALTWTFRERISSRVTDSPAYGSLVFWTFCATAVASLKTYFLSYFKNTTQSKLFARYTVDETVIGAVLAVFLVGVAGVGPLGLAVGPLVASALVFVALLRRFVAELPPRFDAKMLRRVLLFSAPMTPRIFVGALGTQFDKLVLGALASTGSVAIYAIGQRIANVVFAYTTALQNVFGPEVYRRMFALKEAGGRSIGPYLTPFAYATAAIALLVMLFADEAVRILAPPAYAGAAVVANILVLYYALLFFGKLPQLAYARKPGLIAMLSILGVALSTTTIFFFVKLWGVVGAATGMLLAGALSTWLGAYMGQRYYRIEFERSALAVIFGSLALASVSVLVLRAGGAPYPVLLAVKLTYLAVFAAIGARFGILTRARIDMLLRRGRAKV